MSAKEQLLILESWKDVPEGTPVLYRKWKGGPEYHSKTIGAPFMMGGYTACIMLEGVSGAYGLSFIRRVGKEAPKP